VCARHLAKGSTCRVTSEPPVAEGSLALWLSHLQWGHRDSELRAFLFPAAIW
jgi:hypothetical protein